MNPKFWNYKRVLVTGHTGFKGGWLSLWLHKMGADVYGYALEPTPENEFYTKVFEHNYVGKEVFADVADYTRLDEFVQEAKPDVIFHMAAQPLVRSSYSRPSETFLTNAMGVVNLLEAVRKSGSETIIINITTDKVYENKEWIWAYRENERLGGKDPYSASKACSEIITQSYAASFFEGSRVKVATARAGNVIGGGDMSTDRLIPDYFRALSNNDPIILRNPMATRPWQHVLDPISGYLILAEKLSQADGDIFEGAWNFGPLADPLSVGEIIGKLSKISGGQPYTLDDNANPHEAQALMLDSTKARSELGWRPKLDIDSALALTFDWFNQSQRGEEMREFSEAQILAYLSDG